MAVDDLPELDEELDISQTESEIPSSSDAPSGDEGGIDDYNLSKYLTGSKHAPVSSAHILPHAILDDAEETRKDHARMHALTLHLMDIDHRQKRESREGLLNDMLHAIASGLDKLSNAIARFSELNDRAKRAHESMDWAGGNVVDATVRIMEKIRELPNDAAAIVLESQDLEKGLITITVNDMPATSSRFILEDAPAQPDASFKDMRFVVHRDENGNMFIKHPLTGEPRYLDEFEQGQAFKERAEEQKRLLNLKFGDEAPKEAAHYAELNVKMLESPVFHKPENAKILSTINSEKQTRLEAQIAVKMDEIAIASIEEERRALGRELNEINDAITLDVEKLKIWLRDTAEIQGKAHGVEIKAVTSSFRDEWLDELKKNGGDDEYAKRARLENDLANEREALSKLVKKNKEIAILATQAEKDPKNRVLQENLRQMREEVNAETLDLYQRISILRAASEEMLTRRTEAMERLVEKIAAQQKNVEAAEFNIRTTQLDVIASHASTSLSRDEFLRIHLTGYGGDEETDTKIKKDEDKILTDREKHLVYYDLQGGLYRLEKDKEYDSKRIYYTDAQEVSELVQKAWNKNPPLLFGNESFFSYDIENEEGLWKKTATFHHFIEMAYIPVRQTAADIEANIEHAEKMHGKLDEGGVEHNHEGMKTAIENMRRTVHQQYVDKGPSELNGSFKEAAQVRPYSEGVAAHLENPEITDASKTKANNPINH